MLNHLLSQRTALQRYIFKNTHKLVYVYDKKGGKSRFKKFVFMCVLLWTLQDLNLRPFDYESIATNQLS